MISYICLSYGTSLSDRPPTVHFPSTDHTVRPAQPTSSTAANPLGRGLAGAAIKKLTDVETWCTAPGAFVSHVFRAPKFLLSAIPRWIGKKIQGGYDCHSNCAGFSRYALGGCLVGLGNICGSVIGLAEGTIQFAVIGIVERALRGLIAAGVMLAGGIKGVCTLSKAPFGAALESAQRIIRPNLTLRKYDDHSESEQNALVNEHKLYANIAASFSYFRFKEENLVGSECEQLPLEEIPPSVLARDSIVDESGDVELVTDGSILKLRPSDEVASLRAFRNDEWSDLGVSFFKHTKPDGPPTYIINFAQAENCGSQKTIVASALGIVDSAFDEADALVRAFIEKYGADNVIVTGASKGGAFAQFAGMRNGTRVYAFNAMGLHPTHLRLLSSNLANKDRVTLINTTDDWLYQLLPFTPLSLVGNLYQIPDSKKYDHLEFDLALNNYARNLPDSQK